MRILIIGGTAFVGRHIAEAAIAAGHDVTLFNRGRTGPDLFPQATNLIGDRNADLSALADTALADTALADTALADTALADTALADTALDGQWDATIDVCAYFPRQVRALAEALGQRGGHHIFISSMSAYRTPVASGFSENAPLADLTDPDATEITDQNYGGLKAACERLATELYGEQGTAIVRPTYVIGPHDRSYRMTYWVERIAAGGTVLAPGEQNAPIQVIDARDMATWVVELAERSVSGAFNAVSPVPPFGFGALLGAIREAVAPEGTELIWVSEDFLNSQELTENSLPLWPGGDPESDINAANPAAATASGLRPRPLDQSIREIHAAEQAAQRTETPAVGLSAEQEAELLSRWSASQPTAGA